MRLPRRPSDAPRWAVGLSVLAIAACGRPPLLAGVDVAPPTISPNHDGVEDVAVVRYAVGSPARVTIDLVGSGGDVHVLREAVLRPPRDDYVLYFGGTIDGRMLPDGDYALRVVAAPVDGSAPARAERPLAISGADARVPDLLGFEVHPSRFSPNQDGLDDRVRITYRLEEAADVRVWLETADGALVGDILADAAFADDPGEVGAHAFEYDAGVDADAPPPPDGDYVVVGEARDAAGNVAVARAPLTIVDGGQARAALVGDVVWSDELLPLGATLAFTATVRNVGDTPIRTRGPEPGTVYDNARSYNAVAPREWLIVARDGAAPGARAVTRRVPFGAAGPVTLDLADAATAGAAGAALRIRREDLAADRAALTAPIEDEAEGGAGEDGEGDGDPGKVAADAAEADEPTSGATSTPPGGAVCGAVTDGGAPAPDAEVWRFEADGDNGRRVEVGPDGAFCFDGAPPTPAYQRSFARSSGAVRLGLEYEDKATDLEYPYRWQLGRTEALSICEADDVAYLCLAPGQEVAVWGGVRFVEPPLRRVTAIYAALMHEDVRRMHGPYGRQALSIDFEADDAP